MKVVVVPSLPHKSARPLYSALGTEEEGDAYLASLLDLRPQAWGLPAFDDCESLVLKPVARRQSPEQTPWAVRMRPGTPKAGITSPLSLGRAKG